MGLSSSMYKTPAYVTATESDLAFDTYTNTYSYTSSQFNHFLWTEGFLSHQYTVLEVILVSGQYCDLHLRCSSVCMEEKCRDVWVSADAVTG